MIQGKISTYNHLSDMMNSGFLLIGFPQSFNRLRESAQTPTLNSKYYPHIQMNKQRPSLDKLCTEN